LVLLEWAMEQHRAGEHAGALAAYDAYSKQHRQYAPVHGLAADCLIRLGRTREAASRWKESENATEGTLVKLESLVCEIYKDPSSTRP
jgi:predicted RNA polymerase sigma factor